jgi:hypothetical protein
MLNTSHSPSEESKRLIRKMLSLNPSERPSVKELLHSPYFALDKTETAYPSQIQLQQHSKLTCIRCPSELFKYEITLLNCIEFLNQFLLRQSVCTLSPTKFQNNPIRIVRWINHSKRNCFSYQLNNKCIGVYFQDHSLISFNPSLRLLDFWKNVKKIKSSLVKERFKVCRVSSSWNVSGRFNEEDMNKIKYLFLCVTQFNESASNVNNVLLPENNTSYVILQSFKQIHQGMFFVYSDGGVEIHFHNKVCIYLSPQKALFYRDKTNESEVCVLRFRNVQEEKESFLFKQLIYLQECCASLF